MDIFQQCHQINDHLTNGEEHDARTELIKMLEDIRQSGLDYTELVNRLIREVGLFPYMQSDTASWQERFIYEVFKVDIGEPEPVTLHREQSRLLRKLLAGQSIAVSAPTSFGKSFVIDSFVSIADPGNVVILVPTIALADETRRRMQRKFAHRYKFITTSDQLLDERNIFIFPQERAFGYLNKIESIDMLIVDEFYKASREFDRDRSPALIRAILELSRISKQRYFLAPNINELKENIFTRGMEFMRLDFNTVFLSKTELYREIGKDKEKKNDVLLRILNQNQSKILIYAGTFANISNLANLLMTSLHALPRPLLINFRSWLAKNYDPNWALPHLIEKGVGVHNGRLHRSLSQIQIQLFEEAEGLDRIISTSSIIEGVNTSAEIVILWSNRNGRAKIDDFTYKNIIGRGGRMFRHFIGKVFILEEPPEESHTELDLVLPDELLGILDESRLNLELSSDQVAAIEQYRSELGEIVGSEFTLELQANGQLMNSSASLILRIANVLRREANSWNGLEHLNSSDIEAWEHYLYKLINLQPGAWGIEYRKYVEFVKILSRNWKATIPEMLADLNDYDIGIEQFFELERSTTFRLAPLLSDVQAMYNAINQERPVDLTLAISRFSHAFLPSPVYQLEEYGLPRMLSRKIQEASVIDFEAEGLTIHNVIDQFAAIGFEGILSSIGSLDQFDQYILNFFYEGITVSGELRP